MTPDPNTDIILKREGEEPDCEVCVGPKCDPSYLNQRYAGNFSVVFGCPGPQELYEAQIIQEIGTNFFRNSPSDVFSIKFVFPPRKKKIYILQ